MTYHIAPLARATTAIAAVLALSSTPSFAQEAEPVADTSVETPAADPLAPEPAAEAAPVASEAAPPPAPKPKVETRAAATKAASARPAARPVPVRRASAPAAAASPAVAAVATPAEAPPPVAAPVAAAPAPAPAAEPAPASGMAGALMGEWLTDERLPYAGGAALGLLAIGGAGIVSRRRKRRREAEEFAARQQFLDQAEEAHEPEPPVLELTPAEEVRPGPAFNRAPAPMHDPVPAKGATKLPDGFDLSRFGPHVQAAYRGPTEDNPSLSLKHRLRRGAALDQQERAQARTEGEGFMLRPERQPEREFEPS